MAQQRGVGRAARLTDPPPGAARTPLAGAPGARLARLPAVDGLRAVAVLSVLLFHFVHRLFPGGFIGVDLFFVISGYVITRSLAHEHRRSGRVSIPAFYLRRARRILPALLLLVGAVLGWVGLAGRGGASEWPAGLAVLTSTYNWLLAFGGDRGGYLVHLWSLSVEEQFYLLWPLAFAFLSRRLPVALPYVLAGAIAASVAWMLFLSLDGAPSARAYFGSDVRAQAILAGCLLALADPGRTGRAALRLWPIAALLFAGMTLTLENHARAMAQGGFTIVAAASAFLIAAAVEAPGSLLARTLSSAPFAWIGARSYSLFLWHFPIGHALARLVPGYWVPFAILASLLAAHFSYRFIERPFLRRPNSDGPMEAQAAP